MTRYLVLTGGGLLDGLLQVGATLALGLLLSSECPPLVMLLSQSCKEKLQPQPSLAVLLLRLVGRYQPEQKAVAFVKARNR